jgi:hypothetical protein
MSTTRASSALASRIAEAALKEFGRDDLYVAQAPAGMALGEAHLDLLQLLELDRLDDPMSVARLIEISRIVDCIQVHPKLLTTPDRDPRYLSDVFPRLVNNVEFVTAPLSDGDRRKYEQALALLYEEPPYLKTPAYQEFCILRSDFEKKDLALTEIRLNLQRQESQEERAALESELAVLQQLCGEQQEAIEAIDRAHGFREAEAVRDAAERCIAEVPDSILTMLDTMELFQIQEPIPPNDKHVCCSFFPSHLAEDNWAPLRLTRADIERGENDGESATADPDEIDDSQIDSIELEIQTLVCERPWLWSPLFENGHWDWRTPSEPISNGSEDSGGSELIPAYIHALIFVRNLTVRGKPSARAQLKLAAEKEVQPTANLLMRAIKPNKEILQLRLVTPAAHVVAASPSIRTAISATRVAPMVSRSVVTPAMFRARPVGPATGRLPNVEGRVLPRYRPPWVFATGRVVDEQGNGIYQASVSIEIDAGRRNIRTGTNGSFIFRAFNHGRYRVSVEKAGFETVDGSITVPQTEVQTIRMRRVASCQVQVRLIEQVGSAERPFVGAAKVLIQSANDSRVESMDGRPEASFPLPTGDFTITVTSPESERVSPSSASVSLRDDSQASQTLTFAISPAPILRNPDVQLLAFVCRRVPRCPNPR